MVFCGDHHPTVMSTTSLEKKIIALRQTLSWMDLVLANVDQGIVVLDNEWRIMFINSYLAEMLGQNRIVLLGKPIVEVLPFMKPKIQLTRKKVLSIEAVATLIGVYDFSADKLKMKLLVRGNYVEHLDQAVCLLSDVSIELKAESALMALHQEVAILKKQLQQ
jgi:PAS domain-containing protein